MYDIYIENIRGKLILLTICEQIEISYDYHPRWYFDSGALDFILFECHVYHIARERAVTAEFFLPHPTSYIAFKCFYFILFLFTFVRVDVAGVAMALNCRSVFSHARHANLHSSSISRVTYTSKDTQNERSHPHYVNEITYKWCEQRIMQITVKNFFLYRFGRFLTAAYYTKRVPTSVLKTSRHFYLPLYL